MMTPRQKYDRALQDAKEELLYAALAWHKAKGLITDPRGPLALDAQRAVWVFDAAAEKYLELDRMADLVAIEETLSGTPSGTRPEDGTAR